jgi:hypothetical protein
VAEKQGVRLKLVCHEVLTDIQQQTVLTIRHNSLLSQDRAEAVSRTGLSLEHAGHRMPDSQNYGLRLQAYHHTGE